MNTNPEHGVRIRFDLERSVEDGAEYEVTLFGADVTYQLRAKLSLTSGEIELSSVPPDAPAWVLRSVPPFAKQILSGRRGASGGSWPRRVLRWRTEPA